MNTKILKLLFTLVTLLFATQISYAQLVTTFAGVTLSSGSIDATGIAAKFSSPTDIAFDASGNAFVADFNNHTIRKITSAGVVTTFAGSAGVVGTTDDTGTAARFNKPYYLAFDAGGNLFVSCNGSHSIRKITPTGVVTTFAGSTGGLSGTTDDTGTAARFNSPAGLTFDASGDLFVADYDNNSVRKITPAGLVTTFVTGVNGLNGLTFTTSGGLFGSNIVNHTIIKITSAAVVTTFAGATGILGSTDDPARFNAPFGISTNTSGSLFVMDLANHAVRKITSAGVVTTFAGLAGFIGTTDGNGTAARFTSPLGGGFDANGDLFVADIGSHTIRKIRFLCLNITPPTGTDNYWMGCTNSDWNDGTNWSVGTPPTATENVYVPAGAANELIIDTTVTCAKMTVQIGTKCTVNYNAGGKLVVKFQ